MKNFYSLFFLIFLTFGIFAMERKGTSFVLDNIREWWRGTSPTCKLANQKRGGTRSMYLLLGGAFLAAGGSMMVTNPPRWFTNFFEWVPD